MWTMRIAFISDIHGNATALDAVLSDLNERNVEKVYVLGDISYRGPEPQRSLDLVRSLNTDVIKGNADEWVVRGVREGEVPEQVRGMMNLERDWIHPHLTEESIEYLRNLKTELKLQAHDLKIHAYHANPDNLFDIVLPSESDETLTSKMMVEAANLYVYAHIHRPYIRYINGKCIMNIGSVGLPFDGLNKASYGLVDIHEGTFQTSIVRVPYDINQTIDQLVNSDYPNKEKLITMLKSAKN
jgi:putative phosphoesterase